MAEVKRPGRLNGMTTFFRDNAGLLYPTSGPVDCIVNDSFLHDLVDTYTHEDILTQQGGDLGLYARVKEFAGYPDYNVTFIFRDPVNTTDTTIIRLLTQLHSANAFAAPFASWVSTNPTPGGGDVLAVDQVVTHIRLAGAASNVTYTAAVGVTALGILQPVGKGLGFQATFRRFESWTIA